MIQNIYLYMALNYQNHIYTPIYGGSCDLTGPHQKPHQTSPNLTNLTKTPFLVRFLVRFFTPHIWVIGACLRGVLPHVLQDYTKKVKPHHLTKKNIGVNL